MTTSIIILSVIGFILLAGLIIENRMINSNDAGTDVQEDDMDQIAEEVFKILEDHIGSVPGRNSSGIYKDSGSYSVKLNNREIKYVEYDNFIEVNNGWFGIVTLRDSNQSMVIINQGKTERADSDFRWEDFKRKNQ